MVNKRTKLQRLVNQIKQLEIGNGQQQQQQQSRRPTRRRRNRRNNNRNTGNNVPGGMVSRQTPGPARFTSQGGGMRVTHEEFWSTVAISDSAEVKTLGFKLTNSNMPVQLASLAKVYDRYTLNSLVLTYHPSVGTTQNGALTVAVDWDSQDTTPTLAKCKAMWPQIRTPVWQTATLVLPAKKLQDKKELYTDKTPFAIQVAMGLGTAAQKNLVMGEIYIRYDISFYGVAGN